MTTKEEIVADCERLLRKTKPHLVKCELKYGRDLPEKPFERYHPEEQCIEITCENGYTYVLPIEANSHHAIVVEIFKSMAHK